MVENVSIQETYEEEYDDSENDEDTTATENINLVANTQEHDHSNNSLIFLSKFSKFGIEFSYSLS